MLPCVVEVCVDSMQSALAGYEGGASLGSDITIRLEVCGNLGVGGGTTPSLGLVRSIRKALPKVEIMAMVRPRIGDFCYSELECETMCEDIRIFKEAGVNGIVLGALDHLGNVDVPKTKRLVDVASPLQVTFHRAFDMTSEAIRALHDIASIPGIRRILTSGLATNAPAGVETLRSLQHTIGAENLEITLLVGSGLNASTLRPLLMALTPWRVREIHLSGGSWVDSPLHQSARKDGMQMGAGGLKDWKIWTTDSKNVARVCEVFRNFQVDSALRVGEIAGPPTTI